jgi:hypothetical protein
VAYLNNGAGLVTGPVRYGQIRLYPGCEGTASQLGGPQPWRNAGEDRERLGRTGHCYPRPSHEADTWTGGEAGHAPAFFFAPAEFTGAHSHR